MESLVTKNLAFYLLIITSCYTAVCEEDKKMENTQSDQPYYAYAGFGAADQGDDVFRPGFSMGFGLKKHLNFSMLYYGRTFSTVKEDTILISGYTTIGNYREYWIHPRIGVTLMNERIKVKSKSQDNFNIGGLFGASIGLPMGGRFYGKLNWDNHLFLAGEGGLLLANGRKQSIALAIGSYF